MPRKKPVSRSVLIVKIAECDKIIEQLQARVVELEHEVAALKLERARWIVQSWERQF